MENPIPENRLDPPLELDLHGEVHVLHSLEEFEEVLSRVRALTPAGIVDGVAAAAADRMLPMLRRLAREPGRVDQCLRELGLTFFLPHECWHTLFEQIASRDAATEAVKVMALARYRSFLLDRAAASPPELVDPAFAGETLVGVPAQVGAAAAATVSDCVRLIRGVETPFAGWSRPVLPVWLGEVRFELRLGDRPTVADPTGETVLLRDGRNLIGRSPVNEVAVHSRYVQVSRRHLVVDVQDGAVAAFIDLSSRGTFVPRDAVG